jgi:hypothetical protein
MALREGGGEALADRPARRRSPVDTTDHVMTLRYYASRNWTLALNL